MDRRAQETKYLSIQKELIELIDFHNIPVSDFYKDKLSTTSFDNFKFYFSWLVSGATVEDKLNNLCNRMGVKLSDYEPETVSRIKDILEWFIILASV